MKKRLFAFNVDTRINTEVHIEKELGIMYLFTGTDCGVEVMFEYHNDKRLNIIGPDGTVTEQDNEQCYNSYIVFPSASNPNSIKDAAFGSWNYLERRGKKIDTKRLVTFYPRSVIRIYKDIFLDYNYNGGTWVLVRVVVP